MLGSLGHPCGIPSQVVPQTQINSKANPMLNTRINENWPSNKWLQSIDPKQDQKQLFLNHSKFGHFSNVAVEAETLLMTNFTFVWEKRGVRMHENYLDAMR